MEIVWNTLVENIFSHATLFYYINHQINEVSNAIFFKYHHLKQPTHALTTMWGIFGLILCKYEGTTAS